MGAPSIRLFSGEWVGHHEHQKREMLFRIYAASVPWAESTLRSTI